MRFVVVVVLQTYREQLLESMANLHGFFVIIFLVVHHYLGRLVENKLVGFVCVCVYGRRGVAKRR